MKHNKFACFILTHGRADRVYTYDTLRRQGYTGHTYFVIDNEDDQANYYRANFGAENVLIFNKEDYFKSTDTGDLDGSRAVILPARNACWDFAKKLKLSHFVELDDDYKQFLFRIKKDKKLASYTFTNLDEVFDAILDFLDTSGALSIAFSQGGDLIGGSESKRFREQCLRKAMNAFFLRTDRSFKFLGRINEDVNTYTTLTHRGKLFFTVVPAQLIQVQTQSNEGGMTSTYLETGTFLKTFYSVMMCPSAVRVGTMGDSHKRIHHKIAWNNCAPKILSERYRK